MPGQPGKPGKSGNPGLPGSPGQPGGTASHVKQQLLNMASALILCTLAKTAQEASLGSVISRHKEWPAHQHCEVEPDLDSASLALLAACVGCSVAAALAKSWFVRLAANFDGSLDAFGFDWRGMQARHYTRASVRKAIGALTFDVACPRARLQQWQAHHRTCKGGRGKFSMKAEAADLFHDLTVAGAWEKCIAAGLTHESLEQILHVHSPFLRKLVLHDVYLSHRKGQLDSDIVGHGARPILMKATGFRGKPDSQAAINSAPERLGRLHAFLQANVERVAGPKVLRQVCPFGWRKRHTQHMCCELRRWLRRKKAKRGRVRDAAAASARAELRTRRLCRVWKQLGFTKAPGVVKAWLKKSGCARQVCCAWCADVLLRCWL